MLDQGTEGACTGFGLAAVINLLKHCAGEHGFEASPRMLYEMAKKHDEWSGEDYEGSSCRGAIRGWYNMGVCTDGEWPYRARNNKLTIDRAWAARHNALGAYYRLRPVIVDYHAALNEVGAIYVSAEVHDGWANPKARRGSQSMPRIAYSAATTGGHAFAIVGYSDDGFIVQNSWGDKWGQDGFAVWTYEDWIENVMDGWVFRLALPTPKIFGLTPRQSRIAQEVDEAKRPPVRRVEIAGHFVHFDDGAYKTKGDYWSTDADVAQTADRIAKLPAEKYEHLMIYAHGGLNAPRASAKRVRALKEGFRRNGIYPYHIMYDTGLVEELRDVIGRAGERSRERAGGITDWTDRLIERAVRKPVTPIWEEMKRDADLPFRRGGDGSRAITHFAKALASTKKKIHLVGHSTGAVLLGHLLGALDRLKQPNVVASCTLMAPACTIDFFQTAYAPRLGAAQGTAVRLPKLTIYNLTDELELDDQVAFLYRKSLLYLVSHALERTRAKPLLGMQKHCKGLKGKNLTIVYSDGRTGRSRSRTHGGFDNDTHTMNDLLAGMLGVKKPPEPFTEAEMEGY